MKLLDFVALYGLLLMPMGAVIFADFYFAKRFDFQSEQALNNKKSFSIPSFIAWILTLIICLGLNQFYGLEIFFLGLPGWFIAVALFVGFSKIYYPSAKLKMA
jgi:purine-cytosine permease-like protein